MRTLEGKKIEHKPTMKTLADVKPEERSQAEDWAAMSAKELLEEFLVPAMVMNVERIKALRMRVLYLEIEVLLLSVALGVMACCAAL